MTRQFYKLKKDLPIFEEGRVFLVNRDGDLVTDGPVYTYKELRNRPEILEEWFEMTMERDYFWSIDHGSNRVYVTQQQAYNETEVKNKKVTGNYFETEEVAQKHLEWIKARTTIIKDTNGFKPNWYNSSQPKWYVEYNYKTDEFEFKKVYQRSAGEIYFKNWLEAEESTKDHPEAWKIYLKGTN